MGDGVVEEPFENLVGSELMRHLLHELLGYGDLFPFHIQADARLTLFTLRRREFGVEVPFSYSGPYLL
jgi:hypothetical protein